MKLHGSRPKHATFFQPKLIYEENIMSDFQNRIVTVVNKSINVGQAMNALGHAAIALGSKVGSEILELIDYQDADGNVYQNISRMPFIVLQANSNKIKE